MTTVASGQERGGLSFPGRGLFLQGTSQITVGGGLVGVEVPRMQVAVRSRIQPESSRLVGSILRKWVPSLLLLAVLSKVPGVVLPQREAGGAQRLPRLGTVGGAQQGSSSLQDGCDSEANRKTVSVLSW